MQNYYKTLSRILFFLVLGGAIYTSTHKFSDKNVKPNFYNSKIVYARITKEMKTIEGTVDSVRTDMGFTLIELKDFAKYSIPHSRNYEYDPAYLGEFLQIGDEIFKEVNSDTLWISRKDNKHVFVIGEYLNIKE